MPMPKTIGPVMKWRNDLGGILMKAAWEIPEILCSSFMGCIGLCLAYVGMKNYAKNDGDNREYHWVYTIVRPHDPRAERLKNPVYTEYPSRK